MWRVTTAAALSLLCTACGGGIDSYEDAMVEQADVMEEMIDVLEDVKDQSSAEEAAPKIEKLGERLADIAKQMQELPEPDMAELKEFAESQAKRQQELQDNAMQQMMKLGEYPELLEAFTQAMAEAK